MDGELPVLPDLIRVMIVDAHPLMLMGLRSAIAQGAGMEVVAEASSLEAALLLARSCMPDVCILDLSLPGVPGTATLSDLLAIHAACRILVFSAHNEVTHARLAFAAGAQGYMMKQEGQATVIDAIRKVARGEPHLSPAMQRMSIDAMIGAVPVVKADQLAALTEREREVMHLIGLGCTTAEIAERLHRSVKTVDIHRQHLKQKLNLPTAASLTAFAARHTQRQDQGQ